MPCKHDSGYFRKHTRLLKCVLKGLMDQSLAGNTSNSREDENLVPRNTYRTLHRALRCTGSKHSLQVKTTLEARSGKTHNLHLNDRLEVNLSTLGNGCRVDLDDVQSRRLVRERDFYLAVEPSGTQERGVEDICRTHASHPQL